MENLGAKASKWEPAPNWGYTRFPTCGKKKGNKKGKSLQRKKFLGCDGLRARAAAQRDAGLGVSFRIWNSDFWVVESGCRLVSGLCDDLRRVLDSLIGHFEYVGTYRAVRIEVYISGNETELRVFPTKRKYTVV